MGCDMPHYVDKPTYGTTLEIGLAQIWYEDGRWAKYLNINKNMFMMTPTLSSISVNNGTANAFD